MRSASPSVEVLDTGFARLVGLADGLEVAVLECVMCWGDDALLVTRLEDMLIILLGMYILVRTREMAI